MTEQRDAAFAAMAAYNNGDLDEYMKLYHPNVTLHGYLPGSDVTLDYAGARASYEHILAAFPGNQLAVQEWLRSTISLPRVTR